jgi:hypothetical protein
MATGSSCRFDATAIDAAPLTGFIPEFRKRRTHQMG